jgi:hypothetical protein
MYTKDTANSCSIYDKSFFSDLKKYSLDVTNNSLYIKYPDESLALVTFDLAGIKSILGTEASPQVNTDIVDDCWFPVFIKRDTSTVKSKEILRGSSIRTPILGLENFLSFVPQLENWQLSEGITMCSNWFINSNLIPDDPVFGLLCWAKKNSIKTTTRFNSLDKFPIGSRLKSQTALSYRDISNEVISIEPSTPLVKINSTILKILDKDDSIFDDNKSQFIFSQENHIFDLSKWVSQQPPPPQGGEPINLGSPKFESGFYPGAIEDNFLNYVFWIPDGECYTLEAREELQRGLPPNVYLSASLMHYYRSIYHRLTAKNIRSSIGFSNKIHARNLKVLCYYLATAPFMDEIGFDYLLTKEVTNIVKSYVESPLMGSAIDYDSGGSSLSLLRTTLTKIFNQFRVLTYGLDQKSTLSLNIIRDKTDLFKKITSKYGAFLKLDEFSQRSLTYLKNLENGPHCTINRLMKTYCNKDLNNTNVFYNERISCGNINITTDIRNDRSEIILASNNTDSVILPLADIERTQASIESDICVGPDRIIVADTHMVNGEIVYGGPGSNEEELKINLDDDLFRANIKWELIDGPSCLRFSDWNIDRFRQSRFKTSTEDSPIIYAKKPGKYTLKVTVTTQFFSASDTIVLHILRQGEAPTRLDTSTCEERAQQNGVITGDNLRCMCPNLRSFGINKRGLFWPIETDLYVKYKNTIITQDFDDLGVMRLDSFHRFNFPCSPIINTNASLSFSFTTNNTYIALYGLSIVNMRDKNKFAQCQSFYEDILIDMDPRPPSLMNIETGATKYSRARRGPDGFILERTILNPDGTKTKEDITFNYPEVTMKNSPEVFSYGGYNQDVINSLGISIPNHPTPGEVIPPLQVYNDMSSPQDIRCFLEDIPISRSANLLCDKGYFHPNKGWIPSQNSHDEYIKTLLGTELDISYSNYQNKTSVIKFKPELHKSLLFKGAGFLNLRSSDTDITAADSAKLNTFQSSSITLTKPNDANQSNNHNVAYGYRTPDGSASYDASYTDEYLYDAGGDTTTYDCDRDTNVTYYLNNIDNLRIKDLEVKLNFLNYPNPKNLIIWLEVYRPQGLQQSDSWWNLNYYPDYVKKLQSLNANINDKTKVLYLLNQESIDHYHHNLTLWFTDKAPVANTTFDVNKLLPSGILHDQKFIGSECYKLRPTLVANGFSDIDTARYTSIIRSEGGDSTPGLLYGRSFFTDASFSKFENIPLKDTVFTLKISVVNDTDKVSSGDELTNSGPLSGFVSEKTKLVSNVDINSICNWELIVHTDTVNHPLPVESIGLLDRKYGTTKEEEVKDENGDPVKDDDGKNIKEKKFNESPNQYDGYNYIVNLENKHHLIPQINLNAPYNYISNTNPCKYYDNELSQSMGWRSPTFPDWAILYILTFTGFTGFRGGGVLGIQQGDPTAGYVAIYQYFQDVRLSKRANEGNDKTRIPSYSRYPFGSPDKALLEISTDGNMWYKTEVPFFKYNNTKVLQNKEYYYIKLIELQNFYKFEFTSPNEDNDRAYVVRESFEKNSYTSINQRGGSPYTRLVKGKRLFYLLQPSGRAKVNINNIYRDIIGATLCYKNEEYYTTIIFSGYAPDSGTMTFAEIPPPPPPEKKEGEEDPPPPPPPPPPPEIAQETILIYDGNHTMLSEGDKQYNQWGLVNNINSNIPIHRTFNTLGEGSYGRGTDALKENTLYDVKETYNDLGNILKLYDDDKYCHGQYLNRKNNSIYYKSHNADDTWTEVNPSTAIAGYAFSKDDSSSFVLWNQKEILGEKYLPGDVDTQEKFAAFVKNLEPNPIDQNNPYSVFFDKNNIPSMIQLRSTEFANLPTSGTIKIENIFEEKYTISRFSSVEENLINNRINFLKKDAPPEFSPSSFSDPMNFSIPELKKLIELLPRDADECYLKERPLVLNCPKRNAQRILSNREAELRHLQYHLNETNLPEVGVLPKMKRTLKYGDGIDHGVITIEESLNDNYYWFNLADDHKLSPAVNANPKILKKSTYNCSPIAGDAIVGFRHFTGEAASGGSETIFEIPDDQIQRQKQNFRWVTEWIEVEQERTIFVTELDYLKDMLVKIRDVYYIPKNGYHSNIITAKDLLENVDNIYIRFRNIPRKLKEIDSNYDTYRPNRLGQPIKQLGFFTIGETYNNPVCWRCTTDLQRQNYVDTPLFYQHMNEMIFRSFYGSIDGIEHKNTGVAKSKEPWEWIPYEYF